MLCKLHSYIRSNSGQPFTLLVIIRYAVCREPHGILAPTDFPRLIYREVAIVRLSCQAFTITEVSDRNNDSGAASVDQFAISIDIRSINCAAERELRIACL